MLEHGTKAALAGGIMATMSGCATIAHGSGQEIAIQSHPSESAIYIDGEKRGMTPDTLNLSRRDNHTVTLKHDGFHSSTTRLHRQTSKITLASPILTGIFGLAGMGVDMASGGAYYLVPKKVDAQLIPSSMPVGDAMADGKTASEFEDEPADTESETGVTRETDAQPGPDHPIRGAGYN